jgi:hypothetical protein
VLGFLAALLFFLPPYVGAFGMLAFLPRWRWLLPAASLAALLCILVGRKLFMQDARFGPGLDVLLLIAIDFGFIAGFVRPRIAPDHASLPAALGKTEADPADHLRCNASRAGRADQNPRIVRPRQTI